MRKLALFYSVEREHVGLAYALSTPNGLWVLDAVCEMCSVVTPKLLERILTSSASEVE